MGRSVTLYLLWVILSSTSCRSFSTLRARRPCAAALRYCMYLVSISPRAFVMAVMYSPGLSRLCAMEGVVIMARVKMAIPAKHFFRDCIKDGFEENEKSTQYRQ